MTRIRTPLALVLLSGAAPVLWAQQPATTQVVKPPVAQAWIDVATGSGFGLPPGIGPGGVNPMAMIGSLFGGKGGGNTFGQSSIAPAGRWVDVTLFTQNNPQLTEAQQSVPAGFLAPALRLQAPKEVRSSTPPPEPGDERTVEEPTERPKGKMLLYWGCGDTIRAGQPRVVDFATATPADLARFFQSRRATQRGAHSAAGRPAWPNRDDARMVPEGASLVGEHAFTGSGVPEGFRFQIAAAQDLMPPIALKQQDKSGATQLEWQTLPTARAYFIAAMGANGKKDGKGDGETEVVIWTSSEQPDIGFGLVDYQTNAAVDRWLKEQVLLAPKTTSCTVPKGVFTGQGALLRMIAYGNELNLAYPPRPSDPKIAWEPQWAVKLRVKSQTSAVLGMEMPGMPKADAAEPGKDAKAPEKKPDLKEGVRDLLKGVLGR